MVKNVLEERIGNIPPRFPKVERQARLFLDLYKAFKEHFLQQGFCTQAQCNVTFTTPISAFLLHSPTENAELLDITEIQLDVNDFYIPPRDGRYEVIYGCSNGVEVGVSSEAFVNYFDRGLVVRSACADAVYEKLTGRHLLPVPIGCIEILSIPEFTGATVRSHPSFNGRRLGSVASGNVVPYFATQSSTHMQIVNGVDTDIGEGTWYQIAPMSYGPRGYAMWIRDGFGLGTLHVEYLQVVGTELCNPPTIPQIDENIADTATEQFNFPYEPACAQNGVTVPFDAHDTVLFVLSCESAYNFDQAVDIAHVIRSRVMSSSFPDNVVGVVSEEGEFSCMGDPSKIAEFCALRNDPNKGPIIERIGRELVDPLLGADSMVTVQLPEPSNPEISYALFTLGDALYPRDYSGPLYDRDTIIGLLVDSSLWTAGTCKSESALQEIYVSHSSPTSAGLTTLYFTEDPGCRN